MADLSFLQKEKLHTGFGQEIINAKSYDEVLHQAGLDWTVDAHPTYTKINDQLFEIPNTNTIVRNEDLKPLGIVSDKYKIVNNVDAFAFTESIYDSHNIEFIRGGSYHGGSSTWLEAKVTGSYSILGDEVECYLIFMNSHDGTGSVKAMILPERVVCSNALNLPLKNQSRHWRCVHSGDPMKKIDEAREVLLAGSSYMEALTKEVESLQKIKFDIKEINSMIERLFPITPKLTEKQKENMLLRRSQLSDVYIEKEDLSGFGNTGFKFISAVADYADHVAGKKTTNAAINRYMFIANGSDLVDRAYEMVIRH